MTARAQAPGRPGLASHSTEPIVTQTQLQGFDDYKRRHSKQNRDIIRENANRLITNRNLNEEIGRLHVRILEEAAEKVALAEELRRTKEELERIKSESSKDALDAILAAVPALNQLRHKLGPRKSPFSTTSSGSFTSNTLSSRAADEAGSKRYPEVKSWDARPDVVAAGKPGLDDVVEATERGSESDWSCNDGKQPIDRVRRLPHETPTKTKSSDAPELIAHATVPSATNPVSPSLMIATISPAKTVVRPRGRRESAMFKRSENTPPPEVVTGPSGSNQASIGRNIAQSPSTPPRSRVSPSTTLPASPLRRSPRKLATSSFAGDDIMASPPSVVDTGIVESAPESVLKRALVGRRRSVAIPVSYAEEEEDEERVEATEVDRTLARHVERDERRGEKRRRDKIVTEAVLVDPEKNSDRRQVAAAPNDARALSPKTHDEVLIQMARSRQISAPTDTRPSTSSSGSSSSSSRRVAALLEESVLAPIEAPQINEPEETVGGGSRATRRSRTSVSYKEPSLNTKMRKPDGTTSEVPGTARKPHSNLGDGLLATSHDRSRSSTPVMFTPAKSGRELAKLDTPSALPSDTMDEELVEALAGNGRGHTLELDTRSSNVRRKSVLPSSRRDQQTGLSERFGSNSLGTASSGYPSGITKGMTRTVSNASAKLSDAARACDLPSSPDENGSGRSAGNGTGPSSAREALAPGLKPRRLLNGTIREAPVGTRARSDHSPSSPLRGPVEKVPAMATEALLVEEAGAAVVRRAQRRQSGAVRV